MRVTPDGVFDCNGAKLADVEHDKICGLFYVGSDMDDLGAFLGCAETLDGAVAQWACPWQPTTQASLF